MEFKNDKVINPASRREPNAHSYPLKDLVLKYYDDLEAIVNDLALKCAGGEEVSLVFLSGKITIKLR